MPLNYLNIRMKQWIKTAAEWRSLNPILLSGELGVESDTGYMKAGDGSTKYNDLKYCTSPSSGKVVASIYDPGSEVWIEVDMEEVTIGTESDAWIELY